MRARRGKDGKLFKTRTPKDGKVDRNSLFLEVIIFDWVKNLLENRQTIPRLEIESLAKSTLISQTKFSSLDDLKKHLKITHPDLKNSNTTYFAYMIVAMASKNNDVQFFINNQRELCSKFIVDRSHRISSKPKHPLLYSSKGRRARGLSLPEDPQILAVLISQSYNYIQRNEICELGELRQVWKRECLNNNISSTKGSGLFYNFRGLMHQNKFHRSNIKNAKQIAEAFFESMLERINQRLDLDSEEDKRTLYKNLNDYFEELFEFIE